MPYTTPVPGTTITAAYAIANIRDQTVTPFASAAARTSAITAPVEGMLTYLQDVKRFEYYNGTAWAPLPPYRQIQTVTAATQATVVFSGIPTTLREIKITGTARCTNAANFADIAFRINGDSAVQYRWRSMFSQNGGTPLAGGNVNDTSGRAGTVAGGNAAAGLFGSTELSFSGWNSPHANFLAFRGYGGYVDASGDVTATFQGAYFPTGPYGSITLLVSGASFVQGTEFVLRGYE